MKSTAVWVNPSVTKTIKTHCNFGNWGIAPKQAEGLYFVIATLNPNGWFVFVFVNIYTYQQIMVPGQISCDATVW